jgi:hypothetical protein
LFQASAKAIEFVSGFGKEQLNLFRASAKAIEFVSGFSKDN